MDNPEEENNQEIAREILKMVEEDQDMRNKGQSGEAEWDPEVDKRNTKRLKEIVEQIGWPTVSKVGKEAAGGAWLLAQHADEDVKFQRVCLDLMKQVPEGEVSPKDLAYLEDRVRVAEGRGQLYGTQFREGKPFPIENEDEVDIRRKEVGLGSMDEYRRFMEQRYKEWLDKQKKS